MKFKENRQHEPTTSQNEPKTSQIEPTSSQNEPKTSQERAKTTQKPAKINLFNVINPSNEEPFAIISLGSKEDTDAAVMAAKNAFETWKDTSVEERILLLEKLLRIYKNTCI